MRILRGTSAGLIAMVVLLCCAVRSHSQTGLPSLESFISRSVVEAGDFGSQSAKEWAKLHPGDRVGTFAERDREYDPANARERYDRGVEGRWCLRSTAELALAGGVRARRVAMFYQPLVEGIYDRPLPELPTESGDALRQNGCRLGKILIELDEIEDPGGAAERVAQVIPGKRTDGGEWIPAPERSVPWKVAFTFSGRVSTELMIDAKEHGLLLVERVNSPQNGEPSEKTINPVAGQPSIALRAAALARMPLAPTLAMLSFLVPEAGGRNDAPSLFCERDLIPALRTWMELAGRAPAEQRGAALIVADRVLGRLAECEEFAEEPFHPAFETEEAWDKAHETLKKDLRELGIETWHSARLGPEEYAGNLLTQVRELAPEGAVNELSWVASLDGRCQWSPVSEADCTAILEDGERFLSRFPRDEWTPTVHLILAEAYTVTVAEISDEGAGEGRKAELEKRATAHYRAWYSTSANTNARNRALVWEEIWALDAGMGPWLLVAPELKQ